MTPQEVAAYDAGVRAVLSLAARSADAMDALTILKPTRYNFAAEALRALAEEGRELLKGDDGAALPAKPAAPSPLPINPGTVAITAAE